MPTSLQELIRFLRIERSINRNRKSRTLITLFRIAQYFNKSYRFNPLRTISSINFKIISEWISGCDLPINTSIGIGLRIYHPSGIAINDLTTIGKNVTLRQNSTIGHKIAGGKCPIIGDNVDIGANVCIIGDVQIQGNNYIGAGSVVVDDVLFGRTVVGNPAKPLIDKSRN